MCIITIYNDLTDQIIARFWYPDNRAMIHALARVVRARGFWIGIKESGLTGLH